jgi:hypothetical protein
VITSLEVLDAGNRARVEKLYKKNDRSSEEDLVFDLDYLETRVLIEFKRLRRNGISRAQEPLFNNFHIKDEQNWSKKDYDDIRKLIDEHFSENDVNLLKLKINKQISYRKDFDNDVKQLRDEAANQLSIYCNAEIKENLGNNKQLISFIVIQVGHLFYVEELKK